MMSKTRGQIITIHILPDISRKKGNQTMTFGHLIQYTMRNFFNEKLHSKCGQEASSRLFHEKSKLSIYLD